MKRITAILVLLALVCNYTGVQLCVDFCCDSIEAIHFGEEEKNAFCHLDNCGPMSDSDCCDSEQIQVAPQLLDFTVNQFEVVKAAFVYVENQINPFACMLELSEFGNTQTQKITKSSFQVRDITQVSRC